MSSVNFKKKKFYNERRALETKIFIINESVPSRLRNIETIWNLRVPVTLGTSYTNKQFVDIFLCVPRDDNGRTVSVSVTCKLL